MENIMPGDALGIFETKGFVSAIHAADVMLKTADIIIQKREAVGDGCIAIVLRGDIGSVKAAVEAGVSLMRSTDTIRAAHVIPRPHIDVENVFFRNTDASARRFTIDTALGLIEIKGFAAAVEAADRACKTADVHLLSREFIGNGCITVLFTGEVANVQAAIEAGADSASKIGEVLSTCVIPRPSKELWRLIHHEETHYQHDGYSPLTSVLTESESTAAVVTPRRRGRPPKVKTLSEVSSRIEATPINIESLEKDVVHRRSRKRMKLYKAPNYTDEEKTRLFTQYETLPVWQLRKVAREIPGLKIFGREISKANKEQLLVELRHALRLM